MVRAVLLVLLLSGCAAVPPPFFLVGEEKAAYLDRQSREREARTLAFGIAAGCAVLALAILIRPRRREP